MAVVKGAKAFQDKLKNLTPAMKKEIGKAALRGMKRTAKEMERAAPVDDGVLKASIQVRPGFRRDKSGKLVAAEFNETAVAISVGGKGSWGDAYYSHMVEFGTGPHANGGVFEGTSHPGTAPQPFFFPTYRANLRSIRNGINRAVRKALKDT